MEAELREAFHLFDQDKDGLITTEELIKLIDKVGGCMTEGEARGLIRQADKDKNGGIDLSEFGILWAAMKGEGEEDIKEEFARLDTDSSGFITKDEMLEVVSILSKDKVGDAERCVAELDVDKDGRVSYPEFLLVWRYRELGTLKL
eukprot:TRINITY_DN49732_c0_g1_i1.p1 TRINITY_DN49732_c0_g1~~TRINITY_DN49732_c0_g1_i1.p1  ORF type:complete len:146 (-),score=55.44 TRINITY_DN49732_c0_g1_i1:71-508(-)